MSAVVWRSGGVVSRINEVTLRRARLVLGWVTVFRRVCKLVMNKPTKFTQPCIPPGSLNQVPAAGRQVTLCDSKWHESFRSGEACLQTALLRLLTLFISSVPNDCEATQLTVAATNAVDCTADVKPAVNPVTTTVTSSDWSQPRRTESPQSHSVQIQRDQLS